MEYEGDRSKQGKWWITALMAVLMAVALLYIRHGLAGWLLPDGRFLETLVEQVKLGQEPMAEAVFSGVQEWFIDD